MSNYGDNYGTEIIDLLKEEGFKITDPKLENTINLLAYNIFNKGIDKGKVEGIKIGVNKVCKEFENKISILRNENKIE